MNNSVAVKRAAPNKAAVLKKKASQKRRRIFDAVWSNALTVILAILWLIPVIYVIIFSFSDQKFFIIPNALITVCLFQFFMPLSRCRKGAMHKDTGRTRPPGRFSGHHDGFGNSLQRKGGAAKAALPFSTISLRHVLPCRHSSLRAPTASYF